MFMCLINRGDKMELNRYDNVMRLAARLSIVVYLMDKPASVGEITEFLGMSQPAISHHLRLLKDARILKAEKKGKQVYYSLNDNHVKNIIESGLVHMSHGE